jgi:hypothetical protein
VTYFQSADLLAVWRERERERERRRRDDGAGGTSTTIPHKKRERRGMTRRNAEEGNARKMMRDERRDEKSEKHVILSRRMQIACNIRQVAALTLREAMDGYPDRRSC